MRFGNSAVDLYHQARNATEAGDPHQSLRLLDACLAKDPRFPEAWIERGSVCWMLGAYRQSVDCYSRAIELSPRDPFPWTGRGNALEQLGDVQRALADHTVAIECDPKSDAAYANRGLLQLNIGQLEAARRDLQSAYDLNPHEAENLFRMGRYQFEMGYYSDAYGWFNSAIQLGPGDPTYHYYRGACLCNLDRPDLALEDLNFAIARQPQHASAYGCRGAAHLALGDNRAAFDDLTSAINLGERTSGVFQMRGQLYFDANCFAEAVQDYTTAIQIEPDYLLYYYPRIEAYQAMGRADLAQLDFARIDQIIRARVTEISQRGERLTLAIVQANHELYEPGDEDRFAFGILTFDPPLRDDPQALSEMAAWLYSYKGGLYTNPDENEAATIVSHEMGTPNRRRPLPRSFTGGPLVWYVDLFIHRPFLRNGQLTQGERLHPCIAEPGPDGRVELTPQTSGGGWSSTT
ncbi:MAG: tetratricopeptide repeat protein [Pirellulaceae bacterium]